VRLAPCAAQSLNPLGADLLAGGGAVYLCVEKIPSSTPHLREKVFFLNTMFGAVLPRGSSIDFLDQELLKNPFISLLIDDRNRDFYIKNPFNNLFNQVSIYNHHLFLDFLLSKNESENESLDDS
jgi:hypothetical protein